MSENLEIFKTNDAIRQVNISAHSLVYLSEVKKTKYLNSLYDLVKWNSVEKKIYISIRLWVQNEEINKLVFDCFSNKFGCKFDFNSNKITDNCFFSFEEEFEWPNISNPVITNRGRCHGTFDHLGILANGSVVACCLDSNGETTFGNIFDETLEEIMNKDSFINFHDNMNKNILVHELCKRCSYHLKFDKK